MLDVVKQKRTALIIGGTGGIGKEVIKAFVNADYQVFFTYYKNHKEAEDLEKKYFAKGYQVDISNIADIKKLLAEFCLDTSNLDVLIYCTGIFEDSLIENMSFESWNRVISVNLTGAFLCAQVMIPLLRKSGHGRFLCIGSVMGESGIYGSCSYSASKAGLIGLVKSIALENAKYGVTANVVSLGYIDTGMTKQLSTKVLDYAVKKIPMGKFGSAEDVARMIVDLSEEHTDYFSGQVIRINGLLYL